MLFVMLCPISAFLGYALGRIGHIYWGKVEGPHHWIYGLTLVIIGGKYYYGFYGLLALSIGLGVFISDLKDFLRLKFYGKDQPGKRRFWGID